MSPTTKPAKVSHACHEASRVELASRQSVSRGFAASVLQLADRPQRGRPSTTAESSNLAIGDGRQRDFDRDFFSRRGSLISSTRSSPSGTTRPARRSANPSSDPSSAAQSLRMRITWTSS